jgi:pilus assembly protein CpaB
MSVRSVLLLLVALAIAGATAFIARNWLASERAELAASVPVRAPETPETQVLVANTDLAPGTFLKSDNIRWQAWPEDGVDDEYIVKENVKLEDLVGTVARVRLIAGQPITNKVVVHPGDRGFLAAVLAPTMRAVSVPINATSGISGFVFPGDMVDVIVTAKFRTEDAQGKEKTHHFSQTLLEKVRVLAIDQKTENVDGAAQVAKTATLEVTAAQAERIALGLDVGTLSLSLRALRREQYEENTKLAQKDDGAGGTTVTEVATTVPTAPNAAPAKTASTTGATAGGDRNAPIRLGAPETKPVEEPVRTRKHVYDWEAFAGFRPEGSGKKRKINVLRGEETVEVEIK